MPLKDNVLPIERNSSSRTVAKNLLILRTVVVLLVLLMCQPLLLACSATSTDSLTILPNGSQNFISSNNIPPLRIAALLPGSKNDNSFSQATYMGLVLAQKQLGAQIAVAENVSATDVSQQEKVLRDFIQQGYNFIIADGSEFEMATSAVADQNPTIKFAVVANYPGNGRNLGSLTFTEGEEGYLLGTVAGLKTKTQKIGVVVGIKDADTSREIVAFQKAAQTVNAQIQFLGSLDVSSWVDSTKSQQLTGQLISEGADVVLVIADTGEYGSAQIAQQHKANVLTWDSNLLQQFPDTVLACVDRQYSELVLQAAQLVLQGHWVGRTYAFGLAQFAQDIMLNSASTMFSQTERKRIEAVKQEIISGKIDVS